MGTTSCSNITRERVIAEITENWANKETDTFCRTIAQALVGSHFYCVKEIRQHGKTFRLICLTIIQGCGRSWSWKSMSEEMHPYYYDCPGLLLAIAGEPCDDSARNWRKNCIRHQLGEDSAVITNENLKEIWKK